MRLLSQKITYPFGNFYVPLWEFLRTPLGVKRLQHGGFVHLLGGENLYVSIYLLIYGAYLLGSPIHQSKVTTLSAPPAALIELSFALPWDAIFSQSFQPSSKGDKWMIDRNLMRRILDAPENTIVDVARGLGLDVPPGNTMRCILPENHGRGDQSPSMRFDERRGRVKCWGCGQVNWDSVGLVQHVRGCSFRDALEWLADRAGITLPKTSAGSPVYDRDTPHANRYFQDLGVFAKEAALQIDNGGSEYFLKRGISKEVIRTLHLGYVTDYATFKLLVKKKRQSIDFKGSGLGAFYIYGKSNLPFVTIPYVGALHTTLKDGTQKKVHPCVSIKVRLIGEPFPGVPKYLSTCKNVPILYNANVLDTADNVFICEGELDTLTLLSLGYSAVGVPGWSGFKEQWASSFQGKTVYLVLDADRAGRRGAKDIAQKLSGIAKSVKLVRLPNGTDINEFFVKGVF